MKSFFQSLLLATITSISTIPATKAIDIGGMHYCIVTVKQNDNGDQFTVLVPKINLDTVVQKLDVINVDCNTNQAPQPLF